MATIFCAGTNAFVTVTSVLLRVISRRHSPFGIQHYFGSAIPSRCDVLCQETRMVMIRISDPSKSKVADFQVAGGVQKQVARLQIPMQHVGRVNVLETSQNLIEEIAHMVVGKLLSLEKFVQISLHETLEEKRGFVSEKSH